MLQQNILTLKNVLQALYNIISMVTVKLFCGRLEKIGKIEVWGMLIAIHYQHQGDATCTRVVCHQRGCWYYCYHQLDHHSWCCDDVCTKWCDGVMFSMEQWRYSCWHVVAISRGSGWNSTNNCKLVVVISMGSGWNSTNNCKLVVVISRGSGWNSTNNCKLVVAISRGSGCN